MLRDFEISECAAWRNSRGEIRNDCTNHFAASRRSTRTSAVSTFSGPPWRRLAIRGCRRAMPVCIGAQRKRLERDTGAVQIVSYAPQQESSLTIPISCFQLAGGARHARLRSNWLSGAAFGLAAISRPQVYYSLRSLPRRLHPQMQSSEPAAAGAHCL